jgi:hypothetical protein
MICPVVASAEPAELASYVGAFVYAGGQPQHKAREAAVERVVVEMNALIRGLARRQLLKATQPWPRVTIAVSGANLTIKRAGAVPAKVVLGGSPVSFRNGFSGTSTVRRRFSNGSIIELISDGSSKRTNTLTLSSEGKTLSVRSKIQSPQLPRDVAFNLSYKRT